MTDATRQGDTLGTLVHDPLIRLVMASDGVSEQELLGLLRRVRRARRAEAPGLNADGEVGACIVAFAGVPSWRTTLARHLS